MHYLEYAVQLAVEKHKDQVDKSGIPYISHLIRVAGQFTDPELQAAAILHDIVEDTGVTIGQLNLMKSSGTPPFPFLFPLKVILIVNNLTRQPNESYSKYIARLSREGQVHREDTIRVKISDLKDNLRNDRGSFKASLSDYKMYHSALATLEHALAELTKSELK